MSRRMCASCKFYERAPIARMGWCRHPALFAAHQDHLTSATDLDCDRGLGAFWEPLDKQDNGTVPHSLRDMNHPEIISVTRSGMPVYPVSGSSGYSGDPPPPSSGGGSDGPNWGNGDGDYNYYEEERYFTDYIRIALPIVGVIVLVVLLWFWIASFLGDDGGDSNDAASGTASIGIPTIAATPAASPDAATTPSPPSSAPTATTPGSGTTSPSASAAPTQDPGGGPVDIYLGATVEVANTDGAGVNVREGASTESGIISVFLDGTQALVIDGPVDAEGFTWWQVSGNEVAAGWVVSDFLVVVE